MKYREIPTSHIRILAQIGSGEFGMVKKGVWSSPAGAVKMLPPDATEKDQIRFLQEAAVNGQFNFHPNIVHLFVVVTVEKPLMMVLELLDNGDLRNYFLTHKALLGKTAPTDSLDKATPTDWFLGSPDMLPQAWSISPAKVLFTEAWQQEMFLFRREDLQDS